MVGADGSVAPRVTDPLSELLDRLRWTVREYAREEWEPGVGRRYDGRLAHFHFLAEGSLEVIGADRSLRVESGDFVLLPRGGEHRLVNRGEQSSVLFSGTMVTAGMSQARLEAMLPELVVACRLVLREPHVGSMIEGMLRELCAARVGSSTVISSLASAVTTAAIRSWVEGGCGVPDEWLAPARDPHIARAVTAIHDDPGADWTLASMARVARSSRSIFAERFREIVGDSPARYVTTVRMELARELLLRDGLTVSQTASRLGYRSDEAFSRAFRRHVGAAPGVWKREIAAA